MNILLRKIEIMESVDLRPFGWAPGDYSGRCRVCGKNSMFDNDIETRDKYAWNCKSCAMKLYEDYNTKINAPMICDYDENTGKIQ